MAQSAACVPGAQGRYGTGKHAGKTSKYAAAAGAGR